MKPVIHLPQGVTFTLEPGVGGYTTFADGSTYATRPHDTRDYQEIARRCGYRPQMDGGRGTHWEARLRYAQEHDVFHHLVAHWFWQGVSPVLWELARGQDVSEAWAVTEEALVMTCQRWVRAGERPIIGRADWDGFKRFALGHLDA